MTPAMKQYMEIKDKNKDCIIFFRMGDFYETFYDDAKITSKTLDIALTKRGIKNSDQSIPLAGIPYHAIDSYLNKMIKAGYKVAIVEQLEDPKQAKGVVKRGVIRVVTPGTVIEQSIIGDSNNYIAAISPSNNKLGLSFIDISTGEFLTTELDKDNAILELKKYNPSEVILPMSYENSPLISKFSDLYITYISDVDFHFENAKKNLMKNLNVLSLDGYGLKDKNLAVSASGALFSYLIETQKTSLKHINKIKYYTDREYLDMDITTIKNLELIQTIKDNSDDGTLYKILNKTLTSMGSRLLKKFLLRPLIDVKQINNRLLAVEELIKKIFVLEELRDLLKNISDIERLISRVNYGNSNPRDLVMLHGSLALIPDIKNLLIESESSLLSNLSRLEDLKDISELIDEAIKDDPPISTADGGFIKEEYNEELDNLREISLNAKQLIRKIEVQEKSKTGIKSLKVRYNKVFGYYIDITNPNLKLVPDHYIKKQTLVNSERFVTEELKELEEKILTAEEKIITLEQELFDDIIAKIKRETIQIQKVSENIAYLDVLCSYAKLSFENNYTKPLVKTDYKLKLIESRHPVVEQMTEFISNNISINMDNRVMIITGPNMAGKCLTGESIIFSEKGMIPIKYLKPAEIGPTEFYPYKIKVCGKGGRVFTSHFYYDGKKPTINIKTKFGYEIEGTYNHPIFVRTEDEKEIWKELKDVTHKDKIIICRKLDIWGTKTSINKKAYLLDNTHHNLRKYKLPKNIDSDLAYFLGILIGEGQLNLKSSIRFCSTEPEIIRNCQKIVQDKFGYSLKTDKTNIHHYISSVQIRSFLKKVGLNYVISIEKEIPKTLLQAPKKIVKSFLQGLFDADGEVLKKYGNVSFSTSSHKLAQQIHLILLNFGIISTLRMRKTKVNPSYRISMYGENAILFHKLIGFTIKRKKQRQKLASETRMPNYGIPYMNRLLKNIQKKIVNKQNKKIALKKVKNINSIFYTYIPNKRNISYHKLKELIEYCEFNNIKCPELKEIYTNYYFYDNIKEIRKSTNLKDVYDFTVPKSHSFVANGMINHNSCLMRQVALNIIMAQIGCYVAAKEAEINVVDKIFCRTGAIDDISGGQSTFMVEMKETAQIVNNATDKSLIILDEIGRGTSTYDGVAIAWAVAEHIAQKINAKTLFATHYHVLNDLKNHVKGVQNYNIAVKEESDKIIFLRKILEGGTDKSYGIHVAKLAGMPKEIIDRSKQIQFKLEQEDEISGKIIIETRKSEQKDEIRDEVEEVDRMIKSKQLRLDDITK